MSSPIDVGEPEFEREVLQSPLPVLVDFWGPGCPSCKLIAPHVDAIAEEMAGRLKVVKVNAADAPSLAGQFGIMGIPTLLVVKGGQVVDTMVGSQSHQAIVNRVQRYLG